ncbi:MAG TPA: hypothetical protein PKO06_06880, partial [Candidatus Ozemobacteraceae bacterium]|nr:hypothetical protein [Candidatus Ozemobacteraceae bacterium]
MNIALIRRFLASSLVLMFLLCTVAPMWLFAQAGSGDAEILPKKTESESTSPSGTSTTTPAPTTATPASTDDLSPFSLSVIILSMLIG